MPLPSNEECGHGLPVLNIEGSLVGMGTEFNLAMLHGGVN
jgi:hypothetical protein